jgi:pyrimidine-nucleoside phosphorylase
LAPADKKFYALRDVTGTVECIPLICASILSKKLAEGTQVLVGDVKFGRGAFMKEKAKARELAEALVKVSNAMGTPMRAVMTAMDEPLGRAVGNALEVIESIKCLRGEGPADTMAVTYALGEQMLLLSKAAKTKEEARKKLEAGVASGAALKKFAEMIAAQGGDAKVVDDVSRLPRAKITEPFVAVREGFVTDVDAMGVALEALRLGAGRAKAEDKVDHAVGISGLGKIGERVGKGAPLCVIHANDTEALEAARAILAKAILVGDAAPMKARLIDEIIG